MRELRAYIAEWLARGASGRRYLARAAARDRRWLEQRYGSLARARADRAAARVVARVEMTEVALTRRR